MKKAMEEYKQANDELSKENKQLKDQLETMTFKEKEA